MTESTDTALAVASRTIEPQVLANVPPTPDQRRMARAFLLALLVIYGFLSPPTLRAQDPGVGAVCSFIGTVRDRNDGNAVSAMELEHYPGMTEKAIEAMIDEAFRRFDIRAARVIHRVGPLQLRDQIVLVVVTSAHRGESFQACEFLMDYLKTQAPFWKKEHTPEGAHWVDARSHDDDALARILEAVRLAPTAANRQAFRARRLNPVRPTGSSAPTISRSMAAASPPGPDLARTASRTWRRSPRRPPPRLASPSRSPARRSTCWPRCSDGRWLWQQARRRASWAPPRR